VVIPLELAHLPYRKDRTYEDYVGLRGLERRGVERWRKSVLDVIERLRAALICDSVLLGGGNAKLMQDLPSHILLGANSNAIDGGIKLWRDVSEPATAANAAPTKTAKPAIKVE
jgi:polyphosphate glucokinase